MVFRIINRFLYAFSSRWRFSYGFILDADSGCDDKGPSSVLMNVSSNTPFYQWTIRIRVVLATGANGRGCYSIVIKIIRCNNKSTNIQAELWCNYKSESCTQKNHPWKISERKALARLRSFWKIDLVRLYSKRLRMECKRETEFGNFRFSTEKGWSCVLRETFLHIDEPAT